MNQLRILRDTAEKLNEGDWTPERRSGFANEIKIVFNQIAQEAQAADLNFDSGPG